jgi:hypothetical protein
VTPSHTSYAGTGQRPYGIGVSVDATSAWA